MATKTIKRKKKTVKTWMRPEDIKTFRTSDPKEMLNKYIASRVTKTWTEKFLDEDTQETVDIERAEVLFEKGKLLTKDLITKVQFSIQAGEIKDIEVTDSKFDAERWITNRMPAWEVLLTNGDKKLSYLVRAQCVERAITCAAAYGGMYLSLSGSYEVKKVASLPVSIVEDDDECIPESGEVDSGYSYYRVSVQTRLFYDIDNDYNKETHDFIIRAGDVAEAKDRISEYMKTKYKEELESNPNNTFLIVRASPYQTNGVIPLGYCELYHQPK